MHLLVNHDGELRMTKNSQGVTLVELMIVVAVIGIMATITAPSLVSGLPTYRIKAAVRDCTTQLRNARSLAIKDKRDVVVSFDPDKDFYVVDGRKFPLAGSLEEKYGSGVRFGSGAATTGVNDESIPSDGISLNDGSLTFTSRGMADFGVGAANGAIYFTNNREDAYAITLNVAGAVTLRRWRVNEWKR
jgi:prepilin-type N-terminal cleavage/methylation domain-containing protein